MTRSITLAGLLAAGFAGAALPAGAAALTGMPERPPYIGYVYPAGAKQGTTVEAIVGGENVYGSAAAVLSGKGVTVEITDSREPEILGLLDPNKKKKKKQNQTVIDEVVKLRITVAPGAEPGPRDLCLVTPHGLSNKRVFQVGQLPEARETEPNDRKTAAVPLPPLPCLVNGQITPGDVDTFRLSARKGQRLVVEVSARALIPYIADAVPGWFQAIVTLSDAQGRELAVADDYRFNPDPVLLYEIPSDGDYLLAIRDSIYRGRADFVYRARIGELPFITSVFPLGAPRGASPVTVKLSGVNLPSDTLAVPVDAKAPPLQMLSVSRDGLASNRVPFAVGSLPEVYASDAAAAPGKGQDVALPVVVNGRIRAPGEKDAFRFAGKKGQAVAVEVRARRLGSPLDAGLALLDARGGTIAANDDAKDRGEGLLTHMADAELQCTLPETGIYTVVLSDIQGKGGDEYAYRLQISPPEPDFEIRATPSELSIPKGGSEALTLHAIRRDGFTGEIRVALDSPSPPGLSLDAAVIPAGTDKVRITVSASEKTPAGTSFPALQGTAVVGGKTVTRPVVPADEQMQAFAYQHLVPARAQVVTIEEEPAPFTVAFQVPDGVLPLTRGKDVTFPLTVTRRPGFDGAIRVTLLDPPKGITARMSGAFGGRERGLITLRTESDAELKTNENLVLVATMTIARDAPAAETGKPGGAAPPKGETKPAVAGAGRTANPAKKSPDPSAVAGSATPPASPEKGAKPATAGKDAKPAAGTAPAAGAKDAAKTDGPKKIFERWTVTLPAIPFRVTGPPPVKKMDDDDDDPSS